MSEDSQPTPAPETYPQAPKPAGPAQVIGCWIILIILAGLVVMGVFRLGRGLKRSTVTPEETRELDQLGIGDGYLKDGEAYKSKVSLKLLGLSLEAPASQPVSASQPAEATPTQPSEAEPPSADLAQRAYIVTAEVQNMGEKTITYLKVHVTLRDDEGSALNEAWVDAATASPSILYIRNTGDIPPGASREFQARIGVSTDITAGEASLEIIHLAVK